MEIGGHFQIICSTDNQNNEVGNMRTLLITLNHIMEHQLI